MASEWHTKEQRKSNNTQEVFLVAGFHREKEREREQVKRSKLNPTKQMDSSFGPVACWSWKIFQRRSPEMTAKGHDKSSLSFYLQHQEATLLGTNGAGAVATIKNGEFGKEKTRRNAGRERERASWTEGKTGWNTKERPRVDTNYQERKKEEKEERSKGRQQQTSPEHLIELLPGRKDRKGTRVVE